MRNSTLNISCFRAGKPTECPDGPTNQGGHDGPPTRDLHAGGDSKKGDNFHRGGGSALDNASGGPRMVSGPSSSKTDISTRAHVTVTE